MTDCTRANAVGVKVALRTARGDLTVRQAADKAGVDPSTWWRIENGRAAPSVRTIGLIGAAFGVDVNALVHQVNTATARPGRVEIGGHPTPRQRRVASTRKGD